MNQMASPIDSAAIELGIKGKSLGMGVGAWTISWTWKAV